MKIIIILREDDKNIRTKQKLLCVLTYLSLYL